jgi:hypothetical protein
MTPFASIASHPSRLARPDLHDIAGHDAPCSTPTDKRNSTSVEDQLALCRRIAEQIGAPALGEFGDVGISGTAMSNRSDVRALLDWVEVKALLIDSASPRAQLSDGRYGQPLAPPGMANVST